MSLDWNKNASKFMVLLLVLYGFVTVLSSIVAVGSSTVTATVVVKNTCNLAPSNTAVAFSVNAPGSNTIGTVNAITITNTGANPSNVLLSGNAWTDGSGHTFGAANTVYSGISANSVWSPGNVRSGKADIETRLSSTQTDTLLYTVNGVTSNTIWLGLSIPATQYGATYTQQITVASNC